MSRWVLPEPADESLEAWLADARHRMEEGEERDRVFQGAYAATSSVVEAGRAVDALLRERRRERGEPDPQVVELPPRSPGGDR